MAKKKAKKRIGATHRRRRRVGAIKPGSIEHYLLLGVGAVAGGIAGAFAVQAGNTALGTTATSTPWLVPGLVGGAGVGVVALTKGNGLAEGFGLGMASVGGVMVANQLGLNVPGISGMSMSSNAPAGSPTIRQSVGQGPLHYINQTVGAMGRKHRAMGALATN